MDKAQNVLEGLPADIKYLDADDLYLEEVASARQESAGSKIEAGFELFVLGCEFMKAGIRSQHPDADEARVEEIVRERLALGRRLEDAV